MSKPTASGVAVLELEFRNDNDEPRPTELNIEVSGMEAIRLPFVWSEVGVKR
jgi:hypothetical protein